MSPKGVSALVLVGLLAGLAGTGYVAVERIQRQIKVSEVCEATRLGDWSAAIAHGPGAVGPDSDGRIAAQCLCWAYSAQGDVQECAQLLDHIMLQEGADDWVPDVTLTRMLIRVRLEQGRHEDAVRLAQRATQVYQRDAALLELELIGRSALESESDVLGEMRARIQGGIDASLHLRLVVSAGYERRGEYEAALAVLGDTPPDRGEMELRAWFELRAGQLGALERADELRALYDTWRALGGDEYETRARYAIRLSQFGIQDPKLSTADLLWQAVRDEDHLGDQTLRRTLYERLLGRLLTDGRIEEALEVYDRARERFDQVAISREEILRTANASQAHDEQRGATPHDLVFRLAAGAPQGTLYLSERHDLPADTAYQAHPLQPGEPLRLARRPGAYPHRWVFRDAAGRVRASGSAWGDRAETHIDVRPGPAPQASWEPPVQAAADGRSRVWVLIPDCADWRLIQYLRTRGELPMHDWLISRGYSAVIESSPAFTGAAMESLVWPARERRVTFVGLMNRLGLELAGLASVGTNPLAFLGPVLPESETLFEKIGTENLVALNLLFSHGHVKAGRHAELIGPGGQRRTLDDIRGMRPLRSDEVVGLPRGLQSPRYLGEVQKMAAEFDAAVDLARQGEVDLLVLRIEPLDLITHGFFTELVRPGQDDGQTTLYWAYRYVDRRLREVYEALDADDHLVVVSDHGIRTALEHDEDAFLAMLGPGVPRGRAEGRPHLRGLPRVLADLLDVRNDWPDTGIAPWAAPVMRAEAR